MVDDYPTLDEAAEISDRTWTTDIEMENSRKSNKFKSVHKKGGHNRCNGKK